MLHEAARLAEGPLAVPFAEGDRNPMFDVLYRIGSCGARSRTTTCRSWNSTTRRYQGQSVMIVANSSVISSAGPSGTV
jgi:hypothetical protein